MVVPNDDLEFRDYLLQLFSNDAELSNAVHHKSDVNVKNDVFTQHHFLTDLDLRYLNPDYTIQANRYTASHTLILDDLGKVVEMNVATANTLSIPNHAAVAFPKGAILEGMQYGAGQVTVAIVGSSGVTLHAPGGKVKSNVQFSSWIMRQINFDEWTIEGDLV